MNFSASKLAIASLLILITSCSVQDRELNSILKEIDSRPELKPYEVTLERNQGYVVVTGVVSSDENKEIVEQIVRKAKHVESVDNRLQVVHQETPITIIPRTEKILTDQQVSSNIMASLRSHPEISLTGIRFTVENGVATFTGTVATHREIDRILSNALMADGVKDIHSQVTISKIPKNS